MNFRSVIGLPRGVFRELGNGARKLWAASKGVTSGRREPVRRRLVPALRSGVWSDFNRANALRERSLSILRSTPADSRSRGPIDFRPWKIAAGLLLAALSLPVLMAQDDPKKEIKPDPEVLAKKLITQCARVKDGDIVQISGGVRDIELLESLTVEAAKLGADTLLLLSPSDRTFRRLRCQVHGRRRSRLFRIPACLRGRG